MRTLTLLITLALLTSCSSPEGKGEDNNSSAQNTASNAETVSTASVRLVLTNNSGTTAYLRDKCGSPDWFSIGRDGQSGVTLGLGCGGCECGSDSCLDECGACQQGRGIAFESGDSLEYTWDGRDYVGSTDEQGQSCQRKTLLSSGTFFARLCYGWTLEGEAGQEQLTDLDCYDQPFELGVDTVVEHEITEAPEPVDPLCAAADSNGFFPNCDLCGDDCDTIDAPGASGNACGCGGGCPCGLSCGAYEIAPNVVVSNICVR